MGKNVDLKCTCCPRKTRKRKHGHRCPDCGGELVSDNPGNPGRNKNLKKEKREINAIEDE